MIFLRNPAKELEHNSCGKQKKGIFLVNNRMYVDEETNRDFYLDTDSEEVNPMMLHVNKRLSSVHFRTTNRYYA